ncbi:uncharacterized membrane protein HdeD (DUF308 family) [Sediminitomix flava]|uniref:Uncharacterized membrane protein HdeD (DUF308 family) n=2 Tax=Sediminitomix flava TaxID=379075 RepID=A0A315Z511_SEDFL|nr:uncharacterized membrane protein HdeD (DUF308 family) [Sediminitomix flava]
MNKATKYWWAFFLKGLILILLSIFVFQHPLDALLALGLYIGLSTTFMGAVYIMGFLSGVKNSPNWWFLLAGLLDIVFGYVILTSPFITASVLPFVVGIWIIVSGILAIVEAFQSKKENGNPWWLNLLSGIISIFLGFIITNDLLAGTIAITVLMACALISSGILNMALGYKLRKQKSDDDR